MAKVALTQMVEPCFLNDAAGMGAALEWALGQGYNRGKVEAITDKGANQTWAIEVNHDENALYCSAVMGEVLLSDGAVISKMTYEEFTARTQG